MSSNVHYNLHNQALGPCPGVHSGLAPLPGTFQNPSSCGSDAVPSDGEHSDVASVALSACSSSIWPGVLYSQAASHHVGADIASLSDQEANLWVSGADTVPSNGWEAYLCSVSPQSGTVGVTLSLSSLDKENIFPSHGTHETSSSLTTMNIMSEDASSNSHWTEVHCKKHWVHSLDSVAPRDVTFPYAAVVPLAGMTPLDDEQWHAIDATEKSLTEDEWGHIKQQMRAVDNPQGRSSSQGEGPLTMVKDKAVDAHNWGTVSIDLAELDPKAQQRALVQLLSCDPSDYYNSDGDSECEHEAQEAALQYYTAIKATKRWTKPTVHTVTDESNRGQGTRQAHEAPTKNSLRMSSQVEPTSHKDLEKQIVALRRELNEVHRVCSVSEQYNQSHSESQWDSVASKSMTLHTLSQDAEVISSDTETA